MAATFYINDIPVPAPDRYPGLEIASYLDSGKNANGALIGDKVCADQYKITPLQWSRLSADDWSTILKECDKFVMTVRFPDPVNNTWQTRLMYPGNRTMIIAETDANGLPTVYKDCKVNLIDTGRG